MKTYGAFYKNVKSGLYVPSTSPIQVLNAWKSSNTPITSTNLSISPSAGNLLYVSAIYGFGGDLTALSRISDNIDGTTGWVKISAQYFPYVAAGDNWVMVSWYKKNIPSGLNTLTFDAQGNGTYVTAVVHEVGGLSTSSPFVSGEDLYNSYLSGNETANPIVGSVTNSVANSIFFSPMSSYDGLNPIIATPNSTGTVNANFSVFDSTNSQELWPHYYTLCVPYAIVSSSLAVTHGWTTSSVGTSLELVCFHA